MTDRVVTLTVALDRDYRIDDVENITNAIRMIKGVAAVDIDVATPETYWAKTTARQELCEKIFKVLRDE